MGCDSQTVPKNFKSQLFLTQEKVEVGQQQQGSDECVCADGHGSRRAA